MATLGDALRREWLRDYAYEVLGEAGRLIVHDEECTRYPEIPDHGRSTWRRLEIATSRREFWTEGVPLVCHQTGIVSVVAYEDIAAVVPCSTDFHTGPQMFVHFKQMDDGDRRLPSTSIGNADDLKL